MAVFNGSRLFARSACSAGTTVESEGTAMAGTVLRHAEGGAVRVARTFAHPTAAPGTHGFLALTRGGGSERRMCAFALPRPAYSIVKQPFRQRYAGPCSFPWARGFARLP